MRPSPFSLCVILWQRALLQSQCYDLCAVVCSGTVGGNTYTYETAKPCAGVLRAAERQCTMSNTILLKVCH